MTKSPILLALCCALLLAASVHAGHQEASLGLPPLWEDVELPRGFALELASGVVTNRVHADRPALRFEAGSLRADVPLRRIAARPGGGARDSIERGEGRAMEEYAPSVGLELAYELGELGWGYLRVLAISGERALIELAFDPRPESQVLERAPRQLRARSLPRGVELDWEAQGASYRIERRQLGRAGTQHAWELLAEVAHGPYLDTGAGAARLCEYRVAPAAPGARFGTRARGVAGFLPAEQPIDLARGQGINLFSGQDDPMRSDLRIEFVGSNGAQISCGPGVSLRVLTQQEAEAFELPAPADEGYRDQRLFLGPDRILAARLPEGLFARVRLETGAGGEVLLYRQLDLEGGRTYPPAPGAPELSWEPARGALIRSPANGSMRADAAGPVALLIEREEGFRSGVWTEIARLEGDAVGFVDEAEQPPGLVRYRLRHALAGGERSLAGPLAVLLVGDDRGAGTEALRERALADLAHAEFERRMWAEGVLVALGSRASAQVRALLESDEPELVAASRRILARTVAAYEGSSAGDEGGEDGERFETDLAPVILRARARAAGLGEPPQGWLAVEPQRRALALLRSSRSQAGEDLEPWRELLAGADPDPGVRLVAAVCGSWPDSRRPWPPMFEAGAGSSARPFDLGALVLGLFDEDAARRDLAARLDLERPWACYVLLQVLHQMRAARLAPRAEGEGLERAALAASLLLRDEADGGNDAFLAAALEVIADPRARMAAAANLADLRLARSAGPPGGSAASARAVVVLPAADGESLMRELDSLREAEAREVDLVLPAGEYFIAEGRQSLTVAGVGLRLLAEGRVHLRFGLSVMRGSDVVLEGLVLAPVAGSAVNADRAAVLLRDCVIEALGVALQGTDAVIELDRCEIRPLAPAGQRAGGIHLGRLSMLVARESGLFSQGGALSGARTAFLERCVVDGGGRNGIEGAVNGELFLLDCHVRAEGDALSNIFAGVLEGAILSAGGEAVRNPGRDLVVCPQHVVHTGPAGGLSDASRAPACMR